jgi:uncharacterized protein (DUF2249 family)
LQLSPDAQTAIAKYHWPGNVRELRNAVERAVVLSRSDLIGPECILIADHDPRPLRRQFETRCADRFSWDYLEQGRAVWRVRIGRQPYPPNL